MIPNPQKYVDDWRRDIAERALAAGQAEGQAKSVLKILAQRKLVVTDDQRRQIAECTDLPRLDRWLDAAFSVSSVDELLR